MILHELNQAIKNEYKSLHDLRKQRVLKTYIPLAILTFSFLIIDVFVLNWSFQLDTIASAPGPYYELYSNDKVVCVILALLLTAIDLAYIVLTTMRVIKAFRQDIWLDDERFGRFWSIFVLVNTTFLFLGGSIFCGWLGVAVKYFLSWQGS